jgi:hypothetical protein
MEKSESIKELASALCKAQSVLSKAIKDSSNPHFRSKFANLESVWDAARSPLAENNLSVTQLLGSNPEGRAILTTMLIHSSGEYLQSTVILPIVKPGPQELGSCLTYSKRYALTALLGLAETSLDDDAELAEGRPNFEQKRAAIPNKASGPTLAPAKEKISTQRNVVNHAIQPSSNKKETTGPSIINGFASSEVSTEIDNYTINFGKWSGQKLRAVPLDQLNNYADYIYKLSQEKNEPLKPQVQGFIDMVNLMHRELNDKQ